MALQSDNLRKELFDSMLGIGGGYTGTSSENTISLQDVTVIKEDRLYTNGGEIFGTNGVLYFVQENDFGKVYSILDRAGTDPLNLGDKVQLELGRELGLSPRISQYENGEFTMHYTDLRPIRVFKKL